MLLADRGLAASDSCLGSFCCVHRLFFEVVQRHRLQELVDSRICGFVNSGQNRIKAKCPSLGAFINLLCVSDKYTWRDVGRALIGEAFDRQVLVRQPWGRVVAPSFLRLPCMMRVILPLIIGQVAPNARSYTDSYCLNLFLDCLLCV